MGQVASSKRCGDSCRQWLRRQMGKLDSSRCREVPEALIPPNENDSCEIVPFPLTYNEMIIKSPIDDEEAIEVREGDGEDCITLIHTTSTQ